MIRVKGLVMSDKISILKVSCPRCGKNVPWEGNPDRPFCSDRCRNLDLGRWADEEYRIPFVDEVPDPEGEPE